MNAGSKGRILVVDDEAAITRLLKMYLGKLGYSVDIALHATEALQLFNREPRQYDVLVADLTLPDIPGKDMALQMAAQDPLLRVLLCSGYPLSVDSLPDVLQSRFASLQKPFVPNMLATAIEELLNRKID